MLPTNGNTQGQDGVEQDHLGRKALYRSLTTALGKDLSMLPQKMVATGSTDQTFGVEAEVIYKDQKIGILRLDQITQDQWKQEQTRQLVSFFGVDFTTKEAQTIFDLKQLQRTSILGNNSVAKISSLDFRPVDFIDRNSILGQYLPPNFTGSLSEAQRLRDWQGGMTLVQAEQVCHRPELSDVERIALYSNLLGETALDDIKGAHFRFAVPQQEERHDRYESRTLYHQLSDALGDLKMLKTAQRAMLNHHHDFVLCRVSGRDQDYSILRFEEYRFAPDNRTHRKALLTNCVVSFEAEKANVVGNHPLLRGKEEVTQEQIGRFAPRLLKERHHYWDRRTDRLSCFSAPDDNSEIAQKYRFRPAHLSNQQQKNRQKNVLFSAYLKQVSDRGYPFAENDPLHQKACYRQLKGLIGESFEQLPPHQVGTSVVTNSQLEVDVLRRGRQKVLLGLYHVKEEMKGVIRQVPVQCRDLVTYCVVDHAAQCAQASMSLQFLGGALAVTPSWLAGAATMVLRIPEHYDLNRQASRLKRSLPPGYKGEPGQSDALKQQYPDLARWVDAPFPGMKQDRNLALSRASNLVCGKILDELRSEDYQFKEKREPGIVTLTQMGKRTWADLGKDREGRSYFLQVNGSCQGDVPREVFSVDNIQKVKQQLGVGNMEPMQGQELRRNDGRTFEVE
jgi:hypothetical protein